MKKTLLTLTCLLLLVGCSLTSNTPTKQVENYLMKYKDLDEAVLSDLELSSEKENLTTTQKENYIKVMKRQYSNLKYEVTDEQVDGDEAVVTVNITVFDLYKVRTEAKKYSETNEDEFLVDDIFNDEKYVDYELDEMLNAEDTVDYTLTFTVIKNDSGKWVVQEPDEITKQKLHGTYNYE